MTRVDRTEQLVAQARRWAAADPDPMTGAAMAAAADRADPTELADLVGTSLEFGTAGLRGPLGPGPNRMNRLVVRRLATALALHLRDETRGAGRPRPSVVVGRDARHGSAEFADELVATLTGHGCDVDHFDEPVPTPLVAHAVEVLGATAAVMVTASHNPAADNGLKVYRADGAQLIPPEDREIASRMQSLPPEVAPGGAHGRATGLGGPTLGGEVVRSYLRRAATLLDRDRPRPTTAALRVVHTSLHGVGHELMVRCLVGVAGVSASAVAGQTAPDPDFAGLARPNPEDPAALVALLGAAADADADVALALDPDADRLAVALPSRDGEWRVLGGDELGAVLAHHLLDATDGPDRLMATTVVSSRLVPAMCEAAGVHHRETLTGFKWLCRPGLEDARWRQLLLYEEALGYAVGRDARDKDGITAALVALEAIGARRAEGRDVWDVLDELAGRHGAHVTRNGSLTVPAAAARTFEARIAALAEAPPRSIAGIGVVDRDRPAADVLRWWLADGTRVVVRPSGTEPKVKYYLEAIEPVRGRVHDARAAAGSRLDAVAAEVLELLRV